MEALQFDSQKKKLSLIKSDLPAVVDKTDVIIKVVYAGICGTDLHIMEVRLKYSVAMSTIVLWIVCYVFLCSII